MKNIYILVGPSGSGKDTLIRNLINLNSQQFVQLTSHTTRSKRVGEEEGREYYFIKESEFKELWSKNIFFQKVEFKGNIYSYSYKELQDKVSSLKTILLISEPAGIKDITSVCIQKGYTYKIVYLDVDFEVVQERMKKRGDSLDSIKLRQDDIEYFSKFKDLKIGSEDFTILDANKEQLKLVVSFIENV